MVIEKLGNSGNLEMWFSGLEKYWEFLGVFFLIIFVFSQNKVYKIVLKSLSSNLDLLVK